MSRAEGFGLIYMLATGHAACVYAFTRKDFGAQAFATASPMALLLMFLYTAFAPCPELIYYAAVWVALVLFHRLVTFAKRCHGWVCHSRFDGIPWIMEGVFGHDLSDFKAKAVGEPLLAVIAGALLCLVSETLGYFVMAASVSLCLKRVIEHGILEAQIRAMTDQGFEMEERIIRFGGRR